MNELVFRLLRSKNPLLVAGGIVFVLGGIVYGAFMITAKATSYVAEYETREEHKADIEQKVSEFKKDVRIAILENNKILLDELDRRHRH